MSDTNQKILNYLELLLKAVVGESENVPSVPTEETNIIKSLDAEKQIATEVVYPAFKKDAHGHYAKPETLKQLVKALNELPDNFEYNIHHSSELTTKGFSIIKAYQTDKDMSIDTTGELIKAGSVLADIHYSDKELWELKKSGVLAGLSIGCIGTLSEEHEVDF